MKRLDLKKLRGIFLVVTRRRRRTDDDGRTATKPQTLAWVSSAVGTRTAIISTVSDEIFVAY
jgi:hypothetical protein